MNGETAGGNPVPADVRGADDDSALRRALAAGDGAAFALLFERYAPMLRRFAEERLPRRLRRRVSAADVLQEAHLVAHERRADFEDRGEHSVRNWLLRIVELKVREAVRRHAGAQRRAAHREAAAGPGRDPARIAAQGPSPSQVAIGAEMADFARRALLAMPEDQREIVRLVREEHLTLAAVGERTGLSREAAKKAYGRAMARFTTEFRRLWGETLG